MWCKAVFWEETEDIQWPRHCCVPNYYSILFPMENDFTVIARYVLWIPKDRQTVLFAYYRLQEQWKSSGEWGKPLYNQLNKHRLDSTLVCLIIDVSVLRILVTEVCGMISVCSWQHSITLGMLTLTRIKKKVCFHVLFNCHLTFSPNSYRFLTLGDIKSNQVLFVEPHITNLSQGLNNKKVLSDMHAHINKCLMKHSTRRTHMLIYIP